MLRPLAAIALVVVCLALPGAAAAAIFGTDPIPISVGPRGEGADGPSGGATISGDDRKGRLAAFHSDATNLVAGDSNGTRDVFVWTRPRGSAGLTLRRPARPAGSLARVSVSSTGRQANGPSQNPSLDGSVQTRPGCVAFESEATNLAAGDRDRTTDVYVRDLRRRRTYLASRGMRRAATAPSIDGRCRNVSFVSAGKVWTAPARGGRARTVGGGDQPDYSLDGTALAWVRSGAVYFRREGRTTKVAPRGSNPAVSDSESRIWAVTFETTGRLARGDRDTATDVYMRVFGPAGRVRKTDLISANRRGGSSLPGNHENGGLTAYAARRGIVVFAQTVSGSTSLYYRNNNSGNIDDLAHATALEGDRGIFDVYTSARANFVAFSSTGDEFPFDRNGSVQDVFFKHLIDGERA
jgi:hypothetical protein